MGNKFLVEVQALDKFTPTFENLNKQGERMNGTLAKSSAVQQRWAASFGRGLAGVSATAERAAGNLGLMNAPLSAMFSVVGAGSVLGGIGAAIAGMALLTTKFSGAGSEIVRMSSILGVSRKGLQEWRNAAQLAGGSAEGMTATLHAVGSTAQDVLYGRNPQAAMVMQGLGIGIARNAEGGVDPEGTWQNIADAMQRVKDPLTKRTLASALGLPLESITLANAGDQLDAARTAGGIFSDEQLDRAVDIERGKVIDLLKAKKLGDDAASSKNNPIGNLLQRHSEMLDADVRDSKRSDADFRAESDALRGKFKPFGGRRSGLGTLNLNTPEGQMTVLDDVVRGGARFSSEAVRSRVYIEVKVPQGARVNASSDGVPVKVRRTGPGQ